MIKRKRQPKGWARETIGKKRVAHEFPTKREMTEAMERFDALRANLSNANVQTGIVPRKGVRMQSRGVLGDASPPTHGKESL